MHFVWIHTVPLSGHGCGAKTLATMCSSNAKIRHQALALNVATRTTADPGKHLGLVQRSHTCLVDTSARLLCTMDASTARTTSRTRETSAYLYLWCVGRA